MLDDSLMRWVLLIKTVHNDITASVKKGVNDSNAHFVCYFRYDENLMIEKLTFSAFKDPIELNSVANRTGVFLFTNL